MTNSNEAKATPKYKVGWTDLTYEEADRLNALEASNEALLEACKEALHWLKMNGTDENDPLRIQLTETIANATK